MFALADGAVCENANDRMDIKWSTSMIIYGRKIKKKSPVGLSQCCLNFMSLNSEMLEYLIHFCHPLTMNATFEEFSSLWITWS